MRTVVWTALLAVASLVFLSPAQGQSSPDTLQIETAVEQALRDNFQAQIARNDLVLAENDRSVGNAGFLPSLSATAGYTETFENTTQQFINQPEQEITGAKSTRATAGAELRWTLFDGLRRFATYDRLGAERDRQEANTRERIEVVLADVIDVYHDVARQQRQLGVLREAVRISQERLRIARSRRDLGSASDLEVRQARVDLNADSAEVLRQEVTLSNTKAELNRLLGRTEARTRFAVSDRIPLDTTLSYASLQQAAEATSPALRQARQALDAARAEQREVRADYLPSIDVFVGAGVSESESEAGFVQSQTINDLRYGASLTFDVFDGFNRERRRQNAAVRAENARLAVEAARAQLSAALSSAFESYRNRIRLVQLERENLEAATANVDVALEQFRLGTITSVELREVQEQRIQAESRLLTARFEAKQAETELLRLAGVLRTRLGL